MIVCSKIGGPCPYPVVVDPKYIFVIMPFDGFDSVYDIIKQSIKHVKRTKFKIERADEKYTNHSIWCSRICKNIRKAKFCITDTTGRNANVFYELGFAHALSNSKTIIITQNIQDAPFDISEMGHIIYSDKDLPKLRRDLTSALNELIKTDDNESAKNDLHEIGISDEHLSIIADKLKPQILDELYKDKLIYRLVKHE